MNRDLEALVKAYDALAACGRERVAGEDVAAQGLRGRKIAGIVKL